MEELKKFGIKSCLPTVNEFNKDSLTKMTDEELENLETALYKQIDAIDAAKRARLENAREEAIQAFEEAVQRVLDLNLVITAYDGNDTCFDIYDEHLLEVKR